MSRLSSRPMIPVGSYSNKKAAQTGASDMRKMTGQDWRPAKAGNRWGIKRVR